MNVSSQSKVSVTSHELAGGSFSLKAGKKYQLETDHKAAARRRARRSGGTGRHAGSARDAERE